LIEEKQKGPRGAFARCGFGPGMICFRKINNNPPGFFWFGSTILVDPEKFITYW
jgi:hypothetical protein